MDKLLKIMKHLRSEKGCPWDRKQTMSSLRQCLLEETYEVLEGIEDRDKDKIEEELGDLLCIISMLIAMGEEKGLFSKKSVLDRAEGKMKRRHPHVFGRKKAEDPKEALGVWLAEKAKERKKWKDTSALAGVPKTLPALLLADEVQSKAARVGFDWDEASDVIDKIEEEADELRREFRRKNTRKIKEEIGDLIFSLVNLSRKLKVDAEISLRESVRKFERRFREVEKIAGKEGKDLRQLTLKELDRIWERAKKRKSRKRRKKRKSR